MNGPFISIDKGELWQATCTQAFSQHSNKKATVNFYFKSNIFLSEKYKKTVN